MNIIPEVKKYVLHDNFIIIDGIKWIFAQGTDIRIKKAAKRICENDEQGVPVYIEHKNEATEEYAIDINDEIRIFSNSAAGAFYALMTLKMLLRSNNSQLQYGKITDFPDMKYRGFYQDVTRGRIPSMETLKKLVDTMSEYKMNSLQLYIEHCFEFKEYEFCRKELGYLSTQEIRELDSYCKDRFIELIPSLSCFGHLYHLLQNDKYKHLCELKDYKPTRHHFAERMFHHTINPLPDESFELIKSLINQHMEAFSSNYFNICCDETFDLGTDVNKACDKGTLYTGFVKKLVNYLESKGKTVMMWADIVLQHSEHISELSDKIIFLNWDYNKEPDETKIAALADKHQVICPGTSSWSGFSEMPCSEEGNIIRMTEYGCKYGAIGMLNTNWGDFGNIASIDMAMYGLILGAILSWNNKTELNDNLKNIISEYHYGNSDAVKILDLFGIINRQSSWSALMNNRDLKSLYTKEDYILSYSKCRTATELLKTMTFINDTIKEEFTIAAEGYSFLVKWNAAKAGYKINCDINFDKWLESYKKAWLKNSKKSELFEVLNLFKQFDLK